MPARPYRAHTRNHLTANAVRACFDLRGDEPLELVEAVRPTVPVKRTTRLGLEPALGQGNLRRFTEILEREADDGFDIVGSGVFPDEGVGEVGGRVELAKLPAK